MVLKILGAKEQLQEGRLIKVLGSLRYAVAQPHWRPLNNVLLWDVIAGQRASHCHRG